MLNYLLRCSSGLIGVARVSQLSTPSRVAQNHIHEIGPVQLHIAAGEGKVVGMVGRQERCGCVTVCGTLPQSTEHNNGDRADKQDRKSDFLALGI